MPTRKLVTRYEDDLTLFPDRWHKVGLVAGALFLLYVPFGLSPHWLGIADKTLIAVVGSVALMILTGFSGQISMGHAAFLALGAYTVGILGGKYHLPFWLLMPLAGTISAAVGLAVGVAALRLKGLYLAIVTIGLLGLVDHVLTWYVGSNNVPTEVPVYTWFGQDARVAEDFRVSMDYGPLTLVPDQKMYFIFLAIAISVAWMAKNLHRTNAGRAMLAVRDHDLAASSLGVNPSRAKIMSFGISSFFAGIAGSMFGVFYEDITVIQFDLLMSVKYIAIIVLGGIGSVFGAVAGAILYEVFEPLAKVVGPQLPFISELSDKLQATVLFSVLVLGFLTFEPLGLYGIWLRLKRYFMAWPFSY